FVDAVRPEDLLGGGEASRRRRIRPLHIGRTTDGVGELAPSDLDDPARAADLLFLRRELGRFIALAARLVLQRPGLALARRRVAFLRILDGLAALDHGEA